MSDLDLIVETLKGGTFTSFSVGRGDDGGWILKLTGPDIGVGAESDTLDSAIKELANNHYRLLISLEDDLFEAREQYAMLEDRIRRLDAIVNGDAE